MAITTQMRTQVAELYVSLFGRAPEADGLGYWVGQLNAGKTMAQVAQDMYNVPAARVVYPSFLTNDEIVTKFYTNVLGRAPDADGLAYWTAQLNATGATVGTTVTNIINAVVGYAGTDAAALTSQSLFNNKVAVGLNYAVTLNGNDPVAAANINGLVTASTATVDGTAAANAYAAGAIGQTFNLTNSTDTYTGGVGNDKFQAGPTVIFDSTGTPVIVDSLQIVDALDGGAGTDTLNATIATTATAKPTLKSIEVVNATFNGAGKIDLSAATGVTNVNVTGSSAAGTVLNVGAAALGVSKQAVNATFDGISGTAVSLNFDTVATAAGANIVVELASATASAAKALNITANNASVTLQETTLSAAVTALTVAATGANTITVSAADKATITSVAATGAGSVDLSGVALTKVATITAGDGGIKVDATGNTATTLTATTGAGNDTLTLTGANLTTVSTGAGNDKVTLTTAPVATAVIDLGAGDDTVVLGAVPAAGAAGFTLTGGAGTDTIGLAAADYATISGYSAANLAKITGFEVLSITDVLANGATVDLSKLAGLTSFTTVGVAAGAGNSASVTNVGANSTITFAGDVTVANAGALVVTLKDATGTSDVLNLSLAASTVAAATSTVTTSAIGVETINVKTSTTDANATHTGGYTLALTDDALTTLNITGNQKFAFASAATQTKLATIDASAATAAVTIDTSLAASTSAAITVTGSAKADTFTVANNTTVTGGAGADTFKIVAPTSGQTYSTIKDATAGDNLTFATSLSLVSAKLSLAATAVFQDYLDAATAGNASKAVSWFQFGGDTYVVEDVNAGTTYQNGSDIVVKLTGLVDLSSTHAGWAAGGVITLV